MPNQPKQGTRVRGVRLDDDLWAALQAEADANNESVSDVVRRALEAYLRQS